MPEEEDIPETWDDRPVKEIVWGVAREHTALGFGAAFLLGEGPKLPTVVQATQLFWGSLLGLLFLSCAQIRYVWLAPKWQGDGITEVTAIYDLYTNEILYDRASVLLGVGIASPLVGWPCVIIARWLFMLANRTRAETTPFQSKIIYGSAWSIVLLTVFALAVGALNMAFNMDAAVVRQDVMASWVIAIFVDWLLIEPMMLTAFALFILMLKWCTSFDEIPEVAQEALKQQQEQKQQELLQLEQMKSAGQSLTHVLRLTSSKGM